MTPAIDYLKRHGVSCQVHSYYHDKKALSYGLEAVQALNLDASKVFKTLVLVTADKQFAVAVLPVSCKLNMKKMAKALNVKKVAMANPHEVNRITGFVLGGVSPLGQKNKLPTVLHYSAQNLNSIFVSAGKRGLEIEINPNDLQHASKGIWADITDERSS